MNSISDFFSKFLKIQQDSESVKLNIISTVKNLSGIELQKEKLILKDGILSIGCSPLERSQIYMNKERILEKFIEAGIKVKDLR